jgi:hypothetical protein
MEISSTVEERIFDGAAHLVETSEDVIRYLSPGDRGALKTPPFGGMQTAYRRFT